MTTLDAEIYRLGSADAVTKWTIQVEEREGEDQDGWDGSWALTVYNQ